MDLAVGIFIGLNLVMLAVGAYAFYQNLAIARQYQKFLEDVNKAYNEQSAAMKIIDTKLHDFQTRIEFIQKQKSGQNPFKPA